MGSDDEDHTATVYVDEFLEDDDEESEQSEEDHIIQTRTTPQEEDNDVDLMDEEDEEEDDDEEQEDEQEDEDDSTSSAAGDVTVAVDGTPNAVTEDVTVAVTPSTPPISSPVVITDASAIVEVKKPLDDSRRLFQRLWTDEDEIELLQGFLDYTTQRGTNNSSHHHHDTAAFYDQIKGKLQLDFNKNQLVEKLRRLKKKYRNVLAKIGSGTGKEFVFKSPHDQATFDLSCKIWNEAVAAAAATPIVVADGGGMEDEEFQNSNLAFNLNDYNGNGIADPNSSEKKVPRPRKRARASAVKVEETYNQQQYGQSMGVGVGTGGLNSNHVTSNLVEETVKSCLLPLFKELVNNSSNGACGSSKGPGFGTGFGLGGMNVNAFGGPMNFPNGDMTDEKWRKQNILELEVYSKRLELMQDQVKSWLEELKSMGN